MNIKDFQKSIIKGLLDFAGVKIRGHTNVTEVNVALAFFHFPMKIDNGKRKRCKVCYHKTGRDKACSTTTIKCSECSRFYEKDVSLCVSCFPEFHENPFKFLEKKKRVVFAKKNN